MYKLESVNVEKVLKYCLFTDEEECNAYGTNEMITAEGIVSNFGFHPGRVAEKKAEIVKMLAELPEGFNIDSKGKGWSFLQACEDKYGNQWTGEHRIMEALFVLGMAADRVKCLLPKNLWAVLPGGMPYYVIYNSDIEKKGESK